MSIETIEGQAMELGWVRRQRLRVTDEDYLLMMLKKTCWYSFIHPCRIGALIARGGDVDLDAFNRFGFFLGAAFQIQDDVLNLVGDVEKIRQGDRRRSAGGQTNLDPRASVLAGDGDGARARARTAWQASAAAAATRD